MSGPRPIVLAVDLDGSFLKTDLLYEGLIRLLGRKPWMIFWLVLWLFQGKAKLKAHIANRISMDFSALPVRAEVLDLMRSAKADSRKVVLATASPRLWADAVRSAHSEFDDVLASSADLNLSGLNKAQALVNSYGEQGFDYVGDSIKDIEVWKRARRKYIVGSQSFFERAKNLCKSSPSADASFELISVEKPNLKVFRKTIRAHQWVKNILVFVPVMGAHKLTDLSICFMALKAFFAMSFLASVVYILNDFLDLDGDRSHPDKQRRPFASGQMPLKMGILMIPLLLLLSFSLASSLPEKFLFWLLLYFVLTTAYSIWLKRVLMWDVVILASLYTLRILAGGAATELLITEWLLAFSMFLFLSLAFVKRYSEMKLMADLGKEKAHGRGYQTADAQALQILGCSSGLISVLVLALYIHSDAVSLLYPNPRRLWLICPVLVYWISHIWILAGRGRIHSDTIVFAARQKTTYLSFALILVAVVLASM